jgi:DNA-binding IclR family transcriptional regulator
VATDKEVGVAGGSTEGGRSVTSRVAAILMAFRSGSAHSLTELARLTGLPVSTTHRLVGELASRRILERTADGDYRIGLPLRMIGAPRAPQGPPVLERAAEVMSDLARATGTVVRLGVLHGPRVAVAQTRRDGALVRGFAGEPVPAHATALGRALLAFSAPAVVEQVIAAGLAASTPFTLTTPEDLRRALQVTRLTRIAVCRGDHEAGRYAVAVPVFGTGGAVLAALELSVPDLRAGLERARGALVVAAGSLTRDLATSLPPVQPRPDAAAV